MLDRDYTVPKLKRFLMHNYLPLCVSFECWCVIAFLPHFAATHTLQTVADFMRTMLFIGEPAMIHFWYMQMLLGIYLLIPVLACFLRHPQLQQDVTSSTSIKQNTEQETKHGSKKMPLPPAHSLYHSARDNRNGVHSCITHHANDPHLVWRGH